MKKLISVLLSNKISLVLAFVFYRVFLDIAFVNIISSKFGYMGFTLDINSIKLIESYLLVILFTITLRSKIRKPSDFFIIFLFAIIFIPISSIFSMQNKSREFIYGIFVSFYTIRLFTNVIKIKLVRIKGGKKITIISTFLIGLFLFVWIIARGGLSYLNFNIFKVYDFRRTVAEMIFPGSLAYLMTWFGKVLNPFFIGYNLWKENRKGVIFGLIVQVLFFAITAHKSMLFYPIIIFFVYAASKRQYFSQLIPIGLLAVNVAGIMMYYLFDSLTFITLFSRRTLLLTASLHYKYYEFFNANGFVYYSNRGWFPKIIEYPYTQPMQLVVNDGLGGWANTGFLANGYAHFGFVGMIVYSIVVGILFSYIDYLGKNKLPLWFVTSIMITPLFSLVSADLPTALLNHGILIGVVILWLMSSEEATEV